MKIITLHLGQMANCTYIVQNKTEGILIDPSWQMEEIYKTLQENKITPKAVIFTHGHYDHVSNALELLGKYNLKAYIGKEDMEMSNIPTEYLIPIKENCKLNLAGLEVEFIHTPGHTPGSYCIKIDNALFSGDTLFVGSIGRVDLPGGDLKAMRKSLRRLSKLPPETEVYCGHTYGPNFKTTIKDELENNSYIKIAKMEPEIFNEIL